MAMPALWFEVPTNGYRAKLMAIADLLHPTAWARITSKAQLRQHFDDIVEGIKAVVHEAGYRWHEISNCKSDHHEDRYEKRADRHHDA